MTQSYRKKSTQGQKPERLKLSGKVFENDVYSLHKPNHKSPVACQESGLQVCAQPVYVAALLNSQEVASIAGRLQRPCTGATASAIASQGGRSCCTLGNDTPGHILAYFVLIKHCTSICVAGRCDCKQLSLHTAWPNTFVETCCAMQGACETPENFSVQRRTPCSKHVIP